MKNTRYLLLSIAALGAALLPAAAQENDRSVILRPASGAIAKETQFTIHFPEAMVGADAIDRGGEKSPLVFEPKLAGTFFWKSQTEGQFRVTDSVRPGTHYVATLRKGGLGRRLKSLDGKLVPAIRVVFESAPLTVTAKYKRWNDQLPKLPGVRLLFNYAVDFKAARKTIYFQDRDTRERFKAALFLPGISVKDGEQSPPMADSGTNVQVEPEQQLPAGRTIDLIVDGLRDADTRTPIAHLEVLPLGRTRPLQVSQISAFGSAMVTPRISITTTSEIDMDTISEETIAIRPEVPNLKRLKFGYGLHLQGDFDLTQSYTVSVRPPLAATTGFELESGFSKTVEFGRFPPSIYFPSQQFFQRSALGLNVKYLHANTREVRWQLAPIPDHKLNIVQDRLMADKELVLASLGLEPVAAGTQPGTSAVEAVYRDIQWKPEAGQPPLSGAYLLEVSTSVGDGEVAAHRAVIFFNEIYITRKDTSEDVILKLSRMENATPVADAKVRVVEGDNKLRFTATSDADGLARIPRHLFTTKPYASHFLIDSDAGKAVQFAYTARFPNGGYVPSSKPDTREHAIGSLISDRNLYRPGATAKFKGIVRLRDPDGKLAIPASNQVRWKVTTGYRGKTIADGTTHLDSHGGWEGEWKVPADQKLGGYQVSAHLTGYDTCGRVWFRVEEYRTPLFQVEVVAESMPGPVARVRVQSNYFHGGPNAGARLEWNAEWYPSDGPPHDEFRRHDSYSENPPPHARFEPVSGELSLDANGTAFIELPLPAKKPWTHGIYRYDVTVNITSPEGRTITNGLYETQIVIPRVPGISVDANYDDGPAVAIDLNTLNAEAKPVEGEAMTVELWHVTARTVKEKLAPGIYRYRNFDDFEITASEKSVSGKQLRLKVDKPGRYVAVASLDAYPDAPRVSDRTTVAGEKPTPYPVYNSTTFSIKADKKIYGIGDTAALALEAPFAGKAWVSIETRDIIDQFVVDLPVNAARLDIPIKKAYFPNAWATVYLVKPGGPDHLPSERMGRVRLDVERPDLILDIAPSLEMSEVEPGKPVVGSVFVSAGGKPVPDADLTIMAVDEAVLKLGGWAVPDFLNEFYPYRQHAVATYQALRNHFESFEEGDVVEKGVLIGGGGESGNRQQKTRKNFVARAFWMTQLRTDAEGRATFDFAAPDNLTAFRVTAVGHTKQHQFGHGDTTLKVAKRLMIEPALPRFVRYGDDLIIRAVVRQSALDEAPVSVRCTTSGGLTLLPAEPAVATITQRNVPVVFRFPAKVGSYEPAVVRFESSVEGNSDIGDAVEITLPVHAPGILQKTGRYGQAGQEGRFVLAHHVPEFWNEARGSFSLTLSHSPWIPKLTGLPVILDYPHGCLEQKSSRYLGYTVLASLLDYLPDLQGRHENYAARIGEGLALYERSLVDGFLPYWPGSRDPNIHVTILAAWVTENARSSGIEVPPRLAEDLPKALDDVIRGRVRADANNRCFALFVHSEGGGKSNHADVMRDLYLNREGLNDEGRGFLALAMQNHNVLPEEKAQLARELDAPLKPKAFDPDTFYSTTRAEAIGFLALSRVGGPAWIEGRGKEARERLLTMLDSSFNLSTQENLWLLIAFDAMHEAEEFANFENAEFQPDRFSKNKVSVSWKERGLDKIRDLAVSFAKPDPVYYLVDAEVLREGKNMAREDRGLRIERVVRNLTEATRIGTKKAPFKLGDEVFVTYRMLAKRNQYYTALTDELPAALETVNFNLAQVAEFYELPKTDDNVLNLDHSELRDRSANLYFNRVVAGQHTYSILARVTSVGAFTWPSAAITPMYEPRFGGLSAPQPCFVVE